VVSNKEKSEQNQPRPSNDFTGLIGKIDELIGYYKSNSELTKDRPMSIPSNPKLDTALDNLVIGINALVKVNTEAKDITNKAYAQSKYDNMIG